MTNRPTNLNPRPTEEMVLQARYDGARKNLFLVVMFSLINLILLVVNSFTYFLFSASIPYLIADLAKYLCGMYPADYYEISYEEAFFFPRAVFWIAVVVAVLILAFYVLCFFLSGKNRVGWLITALVCFALDTVVMFLYYGISADMIMDIVFHVWVIVSLSIGIHAHFKRKKLMESWADAEQDGDAWTEGGEVSEQGAPGDSPARGVADPNVKHRILAQAEQFGHTVIYRRVGKTNELVIDGKVYDEYTASMEQPHELAARVDGHEFTAGLTKGSRSYITADGETVAKKMRWI